MKKVKVKKTRTVSDTALLQLWAKVVKARAGNKCEYPGCTVRATQLHPHHFYSRRHINTRYDPRNGICLCAVHHVFGVNSAHSDPNFKDIIINSGVRSIEWFHDITERKNVIQKNNQFHRQNWKISLKCMLEKY
ncbi:MAG: hypothetical protein PHW03_05420 [Eubacteriales bacterium]|nr:hypothetical protein [Eubacteriales bacterium]